MNWLTKAIKFGEKIKKVLRKRPSKEDIANSDWTSCCKGPILKKDLENNLWVCNLCGKHHRISCRQRFDIVFGKNNYEILKTIIKNNKNRIDPRMLLNISNIISVLFMLTHLDTFLLYVCHYNNQVSN